MRVSLAVAAALALALLATGATEEGMMGEWVAVGEVSGAMSVFSDTGLGSDLPYNYRVRARGPTGVSPWSAIVTLRTKRPRLASLILTPSQVVAGQSAQARVILTAKAPAGGQAVTLRCDHPSVTVASVLLIPAGALEGTVMVQTNPAMASATATVTAAINGSEARALLTVTSAAPGVPLNVRVTDVTEVGVVLQWEPGGGGGVEAYEIERFDGVVPGG